ncbi:MAG: hypothetical protein COU22_01775 [Candidatus Komeilibacteria bacterium CG10_big_fil_rev_8_21_14_0_10_41_13]|uniref:Uncharacterized protein n=1 Tax=Candidatus Komeilibacteria bacterium CG10_big_fil_rev_8_21_14_0_10_41_13 TaxID=1974476 RepID=A0A2M6WCN9_9BACT|nr:MAG: hypothetical protein COU22_01775 [Candidatus Komeilibacteria bacterium CG10_big_fil_rev_8_21_14_0_10_41_13]
MEKFEEPILPSDNIQNDIELEQEQDPEFEQLESELAELESEKDSKWLQIKISIGKLIRFGYGLTAIIGILRAEDVLAESKAEQLQAELANKQDNVVLVDSLEGKNPKIEGGDDELESETNQLIEELNEYIESNEILSQKSHLPVAWAAAVEKPTDHQISEMIQLVDEAVEKAKTKDFNSLGEKLSYINNQLDDNLEDDKVTPLLKDAFPTQEGQSAKGTLDCDSRSILINSVLVELGEGGDQVKMIILKGHMVLFNMVDGNIFEPSTGETFDFEDLPDDFKSQMHVINNFKQFLSHNVGNLAAKIDYDSRGFRSIFGSKDKEISDKKPEELYQMALELDPDNINAALNFINKVEYKDNYNETVINVYKSIIEKAISRIVNFEATLNQVENQEVIFTDEKEGASQNLLLEAIKKSRHIENLVRRYADFLLNNGNTERSIDVYQALLDACIDQPNFINLAWDRPQMIKAHFASGEHDQVIKMADSVLAEISDLIDDERALGRTGEIDVCNDSMEERKNKADSNMIISSLAESRERIKSQKLASRIMSGELRIAPEEVKLYENDPLLGPYILGGSWSFNYAEVKETLEQWKGMEDLLEVLHSTPLGKYDDLINNLEANDQSWHQKFEELADNIRQLEKDVRGLYKVNNVSESDLQLLSFARKLVLGEFEINISNLGDFYMEYSDNPIVKAMQRNFQGHPGKYNQIMKAITQSNWFKNNHILRLVYQYNDGERQKQKNNDD